MSIVELLVDIDCPGCQRKIKKALSKLDGVDTIDIDMDLQKVTVTGWVDQEKVLKAIRRMGKSAELYPLPYDPKYHDFNRYYGQYYPTQASNYYPEQSQEYYTSPDSYFTIEPPSTYNYHKQGYNGDEYSYYQQPPSAVYENERASTMFSEDNATGCRIM